MHQSDEALAAHAEEQFKMEKLYEDTHVVGGMSRYAYEDDPKRLTFTSARYKHTAKMLEGKDHVLEVGCADGYWSRIVRQHVGHLTAIDVDAKAIVEAKKNNSPRWPIDFRVGSIFDGHPLRYSAVYLLDVLEHVPPSDQLRFLAQLSTLASVAVIGMPSLESQQYASKLSKEGHVNCQSGQQLRQTLMHFWKQVFMFSMHDEALGTGYLPMAQYLLALCVR